MYKYKGFTLIELLAVIVVLTIILLIAVPNIVNLIRNARNDAYLRQNDLIVDAAEKYVLQNEKNIVWTNDEATIYLSDLQNTNLLDKPLKDPRGGQYNNSIPNGTRILVTRNNNQYSYTLTAISGTDTIPPVITLLGNASVDIYIGDTYIDQGATALDNVDGNITSNIVVTNTVNILVAGTYTVTYNVTDGSGNSATPITRTVNVRNLTYTFTNASQTGQNGPTQAQIDTAYVGTSLAGKVTVTSGIQSWTVPKTGTYRIEVYGAQGGNNTKYVGGKGARVRGDFNLTTGEVIKILVGQQGLCTTTLLVSCGGGGGTYVYKSVGNALLIIAGGGGGASNMENGDAGQIGTNGTAGGGTAGTGGRAGNNGIAASCCGCSAGAGWNQNSAAFGDPTFATAAYSCLNGGKGSTMTNVNGGYGGFGGGGAGIYGGGGAGGYSGGGADCGTIGYEAGGGGGSYNSGTNTDGTIGERNGQGQVVITYIP